MGDISKIMRFGLPYVRRYWLRFTLGIVFGVLFGVSNGLTVGAVKLMLTRLQDPAAAVARPLPAKAAAPPASAAMQTVHGAAKQFGHELYVTVDPWLPLFQRPLDWKQVLGGLLILPLIAGLRGIMSYATTYCLAWAGQRISNDVKEDVFRKITSLSLDFYHQHTTAELMSRINDDTGALNNCLRLGLSDLIKEPSTIVVIFATLLVINWKLTILALIFAPLCVIPTRIASRRIKAQGRQDNVNYVQQSGVAMEAFQNVRVTKAYDLGPEQARLFRRAGDRSSHFTMKSVQSRAMLNPIVETINTFGMGAVFVYAVWSGITVEVLGAFLVALVLFYQPFKKLSTIQVYFTQAGMAVGRLMDIFKVEPSVREPQQPRELTRFRDALEFHDVSFSYGDGPVLDRIRFKLPRGTRLGLAGESGSGKSSLLNLLFRFYDPTAGSITLDGVAIDDFRLADLRGQLALVSQDVLLFNTTVAENISYGKRAATREEIIAAAKEAHAHAFITELPQGYDTPLGERGQRLSGGQRQRIAIARAFIRNAPILVLDEATAALDSQSEAEVQKAIDHLVENRTVICVAHRLSTLRGMDRILVLQRGQVVETGGFEELLTRGGIFADMAARQGIRAQAAAV
jgi:subfamily B ATP-binding cassette protein MsbA